ncbi:hypothetical protein ACLOJK_031014 [Asimina triloba]
MKPIMPTELYRAVRESQLIGLSGYSKEGLPVFAIGVGLSTYDKASPSATKKQGRHIGTCLKVLDMTGLKLSALSQIKVGFANEERRGNLLTIISTIDDLNYPEKTETYYIVNAPYIFSACWKVKWTGLTAAQVVKPLLQERTRKKVQVLQGSGRDELLKVMDYASLPHFCKREGSGSSRYSSAGVDYCFSADHTFHQQVYNYIKQQAQLQEPAMPIKQGSFHVDFPDPEPEKTVIAQTIESEFHKLSDRNGLSHSLDSMKINVE